MRNLLLSGGPGHPFEQTTPQLSSALSEAGLRSTVFTDIEQGLQALAREDYELLTVHCLRWTMSQSAKYAPLRSQWAFDLSEAGRRAIVAHLERGGGVLGLHTAAISFDTWPEWRDCLGTAWVWGVSNHPPLGPVEVTIEAPDHPVTRGLEGFVCEDEAYADMAIAPSSVVLAHVRAGSEKVGHPAVCVQDGTFRGRTAYIAIGHGPATFDRPHYQKLVRQAAAWCCEVPS